MSELATANLETEAAPSDTPVTAEPQSMESLVDAALDETSEAPVGEAPKPGVDRGDGRDAHGKFATKAEQAAAEAAANATSTKPGEVAPEVQAAKPFRYRALNKTHDLADSVIDDNGNVTIPAARVGELAEAFNARHLVQGEYAPVIERYKADNQQLSAKLRELEEARGQKETQASQILDGLSAIAEIEDDVASVEAFIKYRAAWPSLKAQAETNYWKQQAERATKPAPAAAPTNAPAEPRMPTHADVKVTYDDTLERAKIHHEFRTLTDDDWKQFDARYADVPTAFLRPATAEEAQQGGFAPGTYVFDRGRFVGAIRQHAEQATKQRETAKGQAQLATNNARRTQATVNAPPVAGGTHAPPKGANTRKHTSLESAIDAALDEE